MELSVIICSHNPRPTYFRRVLDSLRDQTLDMVKWELLIVDNASSEPLKVAWDLSWHPNARHIREDQLGVAVARQRGIREMSTDLLVFVDDDNLLNADYLSEVVRIKYQWPMLGVWGSGCIVPELEIEVPDHLNEFLGVLTLREIKTPRWANTFPADGLYPEVAPWGAGQCIRAIIAKEYCRLDEQSKIRIPSRNGSPQFGFSVRIALRTLLGGRHLLGSSRGQVRTGGTGEDVEICFVACSLGCGMGIFPELKVTHLIPKERISDDYFLRMGEFTGASNLLLEYKWQGVMPYDPLSFKGMLRVIRHALKKRGFSRQMHFASVRAAIRARAIIQATRNEYKRSL